MPAVELGFRRPQRQPVRDGAELGRRAGRDDQAARRAAAHVGAEKDAVQSVAQSRRSAATAPGRFSTGKLSPVSTASLTKKSVASRIDAVGRHEAAGREQHDVAWHDLVHRDFRGLPIAQHASARSHTRLQSRRRRLGLVLARIADADGREHDHQDDDGIHPLAGHRRRAGREDQHQQQRVSDLVHQHPRARQAPVLAHLVRSILAKPSRGLRCGQAVTCRAESLHQNVCVSAPVMFQELALTFPVGRRASLLLRCCPRPLRQPT